MADFHSDALTAIKTAIEGLSLTGLQTGEVAIRRQPFRVSGDKTLVPHRGITLHPEPERQDPGTNRSEDIGYGCGVTMYAGADHASTTLGNVTEWRRLIRRAFINQRLSVTAPSNGHVCISTVEHGDFAKDFDHHKYEIGTLLIRVWTRETRT